MERTIKPEILDHLAPQDPAAIKSRKDLQTVNRLMGNATFLAAGFQENLPRSTPLNILELGGGDGTLMLEIARKISGNIEGRVSLWILDQQEIISPGTKHNFEELGWNVCALKMDVFAWASHPQGFKLDAIACNLFLHHFEAEALRRIFTAASSCSNAFIAAEPRRNAFALAVTKMLWAIGCNHVTRHDAPISIRAGFNKAELTNLWPDTDNFEIKENRAGVFTHLFSAVRKDLYSTSSNAP